MGVMDREISSGGKADRNMSQTGTTMGEKGGSGEREPKGANRIDRGDRSESMKGGVAMGMADKGRKNCDALESIHTDTGNGKTVYRHSREYGKAKY